MRILIFILLLTTTIAAQDFKEKAAELNIGHTTYSPNMMAGGVSIFDFNNDGCQDIYLTGGAYPDHLYQNLGDGSFKDVSDQMGISSYDETYTMGVVAGDLDNDGFTDLYITTYNSFKDICLRNNGGSFFTNVAEEAGFFGVNWSAGASMADVDLDGDLDIFVSNFLNFESPPFFNSILEGQPNFFYENLGNWEFKGNSEIFAGSKIGCSLVSCFTDVNGDLLPDLFVINDFGYLHGQNEFFLNADEGTFIELGDQMKANAAMDGMGIAVGDFDQDGAFDYYLSNVGDNIFYKNEGGLHFSDISEDYNINNGIGYSWGTFFADLNNDSYVDLFVGKGSISESIDPQENKLYEYYPYTANFADVSNLKGLNHSGKSRGLAYGDLNNDGNLDLVINCVRVLEANEDRPLIYMNNTSIGNYLSIDLEGTTSNRSAYGSRIEVFAGEQRLIRESRGGSSYLSSNSSIQHFGLGNMDPDSMIVFWPSGMVQKFDTLTAKTSYSLKEGEGLKILRQEISKVNDVKYFSDIAVFPNPTNTTLNVATRHLDLENSILFLYDNLGRSQELNYSFTSPHHLVLDTGKLMNGLYFLKVEDNGHWRTFKIQVEIR